MNKKEKNKFAIEAIENRIGYLKDNMHRYEKASMLSQQMEDEYKLEILQLENSILDLSQ
jgi:hypothetical protein